MNDIRLLLLQTVGYTRRVERRIEETKDDFHLMVKAEIGGTLAHFETRLDKRFDVSNSMSKPNRQTCYRIEAL